MLPAWINFYILRFLNNTEQMDQRELKSEKTKLKSLIIAHYSGLFLRCLATSLPAPRQEIVHISPNKILGDMKKELI